MDGQQQRGPKEMKKRLLHFVVALLHVASSHCRRLDQAQALHEVLTSKAIRTTEWVPPDKMEGPSLHHVGSMEQDLMPGGLPGQPSKVKFKQYAGHITVEKLRERRLFYYFAEAASDPSSKPLILWLNGGPGCSSLGYGGMEEIGPFGVNPDNKTLYRRRHAWNTVANTLFLESPSGVGFSYSNNPLDYSTSGDTRTAQDNYAFLRNWFERFPHYKGRDFYIAGESYAGYYIPELADLIIQQNKHMHSFVINLNGIMVGNGLTNPETDFRGSYDYAWSHALMSDETHKGLIRYCTKEHSNSNYSDFKCKLFLTRQTKEAGNIDWFNIYAPICANGLASAKRKHGGGGFDPCADDYILSYLNLPHVQEALHINRSLIPYTWEFCRVLGDWADRPSSMIPTYRRLISAGLRIFLYSGDMDGILPVTGTQYSIQAMNLSVKEAWRPWVDDIGEDISWQGDKGKGKTNKIAVLCNRFSQQLRLLCLPELFLPFNFQSFPGLLDMERLCPDPTTWPSSPWSWPWTLWSGLGHRG